MTHPLAIWKYLVHRNSQQVDSFALHIGKPFLSIIDVQLWRCPLGLRGESDSKHDIEHGIIGRDALTSLFNSLTLAQGFAEELKKDYGPDISYLSQPDLWPEASGSEIAALRGGQFEGEAAVSWVYRLRSQSLKVPVNLHVTVPKRDETDDGLWRCAFHVEGPTWQFTDVASGSDALLVLLIALIKAQNYTRALKATYGDDITYLGLARLWPTDIVLFDSNTSNGYFRMEIGQDT